MRVLSTGVKLKRDKKGGAKKGMWTRLSSRVGVKNVKTDSINSSGTKGRSFEKHKAMDEDTEKEKKIKLDAETNELSDILASYWDRWRLLNSPARSNESSKLKLPRAWEPTNSKCLEKDYQGTSSQHCLLNGDKI